MIFSIVAVGMTHVNGSLTRPSLIFKIDRIGKTSLTTTVYAHGASFAAPNSQLGSGIIILFLTPSQVSAHLLPNPVDKGHHSARLLIHAKSL